MAPLHVIIIDDDPRDCELLRFQLKLAAPDAHVLGEVHSVSEARHRLGQYDYDVVFLDVHLPDGNGFDLVPFVGPDSAIIFVTGHDAHAVRAFEVNAVDYIVKPVTVSRLAKTLLRIESGKRSVDDTVRKYKSGDRIFLRGSAAGGRFVPVGDITAIISSENYSEVLLASGERWFLRQTMRYWEQSLPSDTFLRVHRTSIVNVYRVEHVDRNTEENTSLRLHGVRRSIPVGRRVWPRLRARLEKHRPS
jgi:two-component system, LytTR family, response regulator